MHRPLRVRRRARGRTSFGVARGAPVALVALVGLVIAGCGGDDDPAGDAERFCGEIGQDVAAIVAPELATVDDLDLMLTRYRDLADLAPLAIEDDWAIIVKNVETASTVVPGDPASVQRVVAQAYASERSAVAVQRWLLANCGVDLGPVATITPQDPVRPPSEPGDEPGDETGDETGGEAGEPDGSGGD